MPRRAKTGLTYIILVALFFFVQLPLLWMIVTALKQPGQAFKLRFFPKTHIISEPYHVMPIVGNVPVVIFEYENKTAQKVTVAGEFNGWNKEANPMVGRDGIWTLRLDGIKPGSCEYKFVVNGNEWKTDPANKKTRNGNSLVEVASTGISTNKPLMNQTYFADRILHIKIRAGADVKALAVLTSDGKRVPLTLKGGYRVGDVKSAMDKSPTAGGQQRVSYRLERTRSFATAFRAIYTIANFKKIATNKDFPFLRYFLNSLVVATSAGFLTVLLCTMAGYAFAKKEFFARDQLFAALLSAMLIPGMIFMVPQFAIVLRLHWINSYQGMVVPHLANVFGLFLLRQYIRTIPDSLFQAARIDGANEFQVFTTLVVPLSFPIMVTLFLLTFVGQWSNFLWQLITNTPDSPYITLPIGLQLFRGQYAQDWEPIMAGACFSIVPIAILFIFAQRYFIEGMTIGAVKE